MCLRTGHWTISDLVWAGQTGPTSSQPLSREQGTLVGSILFYSLSMFCSTRIGSRTQLQQSLQFTFHKKTAGRPNTRHRCCALVWPAQAQQLAMGALDSANWGAILAGVAAAALLRTLVRFAGWAGRHC